MENISEDYKSSCIYKLEGKVKNYSNVYIYGAGRIGRFVMTYLEENGVSDKVAAFIVSSKIAKEEQSDNIFKKTVYLIDEVKFDDNDMILLAAGKTDRQEMFSTCRAYKINNVIEIDLFDRMNPFKMLPESEYPLFIKCWYTMTTSKRLNLEHPKTFNEKISWLKIYDRNPLKKILVDKYAVKEWVKSKIGGGYVVPLLGVYDKFDDIDFDKLPDQFVLKRNIGSWGNVIVKDKSQFDISAAKEKFDSLRQQNSAYSLFNLQYKDVVPKIIADKYLEDESGELPDYKIFCFNGEPKLIQYDRHRFINHIRRFYTTDWKPLDFRCIYPLDTMILEKPKVLDKMLDLARVLSEGFFIVRVDFYIVKDKIYFGEMTFTHEGGKGQWIPESVDEELGKLIKLPID